MPFADRWQRSDQGPGFVDRIRDTVRTPTPVKAQIEQANRQIKLLIAQLEGAGSRIRERDQKIFGQVVSSIAKRDAQHAAVYANELIEVRKTGKMVTQSQLALEQITLRLATITDLGEVANTLAPAVSVIRSMKEGLGSAIPEADREIGEISGLLSSILVDAATTGGPSLNFDAANEDAQKVLDEAAAVAEQRMEESFPTMPSNVVARREQEDLSA